MRAHQTYTLRLSTCNRGRHCVDRQPVQSLGTSSEITGSQEIDWLQAPKCWFGIQDGGLCVIIRHTLPWPNKVETWVETPLRIPMWTALPPVSGHFCVHLHYGFGPFLYSQPALQTKKTVFWFSPISFLPRGHIAPPYTYQLKLFAMPQILEIIKVTMASLFLKGTGRSKGFWAQDTKTPRLAGQDRQRIQDRSRTIEEKGGGSGAEEPVTKPYSQPMGHTLV